MKKQVSNIKPVVLLSSQRGSLIDREHAGFILVVNEQGEVLKKVGESYDCPFYLRSCAKPLQALPLLSSGAYNEFGLSPKHLAVCCASHSGTPEHVDLVSDILSKIGLDESYLQCGAHHPLDQTSRHALIKDGLQPSQFHNNCSGKHASMLAICRHNGWDVQNYLDLEHPLQQEILNIHKHYIGISEPFVHTLDGCGTPVFAASLSQIATSVLKIFLLHEKILDVFRLYPNLIGGDERQDSEIIKISNGNLVSKVGSEGLIFVVNPEKKQSLVVKIQDSSMQARALVTIECLKQLSWVSQVDIDKYQYKNFNKVIKNHKGQIVGEFKTNFAL